jgi:hypothetical protein
VPRALEDRDFDDVLRRNFNFLDFEKEDFNGPTIGAEWLVGLGEHFDAGLGVGFSSRSVRTANLDYEFPNGDLIEQDIKLRMVPFTATVRYLPLGRSDAFEPYIGGGVGVIAFRYRETGDFADDFGDLGSGTYTGSGAATGPVILGGARFPVGRVSLGGEIRWQSAKGDLPSDQFFAGDTIDLGGFSYLFTVKVPF